MPFELYPDSYNLKNFVIQGAAKVREYRKNKITFTSGNGFEPNFQHH